MKLAADRVKSLCARRGISVQALLEQAGVSRTAYYSLMRRDSVLPRTVRELAGALGVAPSDLLEEAPAVEWRARALLREAQRIVAQTPGASFENVWHTLALLEEPPVDRLRRSLLRGRANDIH